MSALQRLQLLEQLGAAGLGEARGDPDVLQRAVGVQAEQQRRPAAALRRGVLVQPVARDHDVGGAFVLDLEHRAGVRLVRRDPSGLATTPSSPAPSNWWNQSSASAESVVVRVRKHGPVEPAQRLLESGPPVGERPVNVRLVAEGEQVEGDVRRGCLLGEHVDPRLRGVDAFLEHLELELGDPARTDERHEDLAVEDARSGNCPRQASTTSGK